jgi:glycosyltransferase involved in cell wall biosynthesis
MSVAGAACIASKIAPYECIKNNKDGILVDNSPNSWYESMKRLIEDPDQRDDMARNAYKKVYDQYSWQSTSKNLWIDAFKSLV